MNIYNKAFFIFLCVKIFALQWLYGHELYNNPFYIHKTIRSWVELRDDNLTHQQYDYSCGAASLSTLLSYYYKIPTSEREILDFLLEKKGMGADEKHEIEINEELREKARLSFADLAMFAQSKGLRTQGLALDLESLSKLQVPVIIYVNVRDMEHFSVYKGMDSHFVYLADPSLGNIKVSIAKFIEMFYKREDLSYPGKILALLGEGGRAEFLVRKQDTISYRSILDFIRID